MESKNVRTNLLIGQLSKLFGKYHTSTLTDLGHIRPENVLVIAPHADDEVIGCGAAIEYFVSQGIRTTVLIVTKESRRSIAKQYSYTPAQRVEESRKAKEILGYDRLLYFDFPELLLPRDTDLQTRYREELFELLKEMRPDFVFIPNVNEMHPDHKIVGRLSHEVLTEGIAAKQLRRPLGVGAYEIWGPVNMNCFLQVSEKTYLKKIDSIRCYKSQLSSVDYERIIRFLGTNRGRDLSFFHKDVATPGYIMAEGYEIHLNNSL